jgi:hypothetical protein
MRKNALKTAEKSGKKAKIGHFPYIKQNSIAEIVSTMELFLALNLMFDTYFAFLLSDKKD